eukprot:1221341-Prymnesium_polylepis.1
MLLYAPGSMLSSYLLYKWDLRVNILAAGLLMSAGGWLRYLSSLIVHSGSGEGGSGDGGSGESANATLAFACLALGQALAGLAQPCLTNTPAKLAAEWFPNGERDMATTLASVGNIIGNAVGQVVPSIVVACTTLPGGSCVTGSVSGVDVLMLIQALLSSTVTLWAVCSMQAEPVTAPSASALMRRSSRQVERAASPLERESPSAAAWRDTRALLRNVEFVKILVGFGMGFAYFNAMLTALSQVIRPLYCHAASDGSVACDDDAVEDDAALFGGVFVGGGLLSAAVVGVGMEYFQHYRVFLKGGFVGAAATLLLLLISLRFQLGSAVLSAAFALMGVAMLPLLPIVFQCAVECTYPIPEESSAALLMLVGNLVGLGFTYAIEGLCSLTPDAHAIAADPGLLPFGWLSLAVVGGGLLIIFQFRGEYLRLAADTASGAERLLAVAVAHDPPPQQEDGATDAYPVGARSPPGGTAPL